MPMLAVSPGVLTPRIYHSCTEVDPPSVRPQVLGRHSLCRAQVRERERGGPAHLLPAQRAGYHQPGSMHGQVWLQEREWGQQEEDRVGWGGAGTSGA